MNGWAVATDVAIWTLILGSAGVFGWFIVEILQWRPSAAEDDGNDPDRAGSDPQ